VRTYCETGVNGGHGTAAMLLANPHLVTHYGTVTARSGYTPFVCFMVSFESDGVRGEAQ